METYLGVVTQATYRIHQGIPVVYLFGRLQDGRSFMLRDNRQRPHFYIQAEDTKHVMRAKVLESNKTTFAGQPLAKVEVGIPSDAPVIRDALHNIGVDTYEADVRFAMRYLIDRNIKGGIKIIGTAQPGPVSGLRSDIIFDNPDVAPASVQMVPRVLSFDIETNPDTQALLAIACYCEEKGNVLVDEVVVVHAEAQTPGHTMPEHSIGVLTEKAALVHFARLVNRLDPDVLTGWNVIDFDLTHILQVGQRVNYDLQLGRERGNIRIREAQGYFGSGSATIPGRLVLDGIDLIRGAFIKMDEYTLDAVSRKVLGEGKTLEGHSQGEFQDKVEEILHTYAHDLPAFCLYARTDARLVIDITDKLDVIKLAFARSALTGMPPDRVAASIASFDFLYLAQLHQRRIAAPSVRQRGPITPQGGGAVFEPTVGIHKNVWVLDFKSLYPSIIRTFNIDPLGLVSADNPDPHNVYTTQDGTSFSRRKGILPGMLDDLFPQRAAAKKRGDEVASQAIKILMNSFYGVLGTSACRFYSPAIANAITSQGRFLLSWSRQWFQQRGYVVLYGDTDSVFVASGEADPEIAISQVNRLVSDFNQSLNEFLSNNAQVESLLELEFEKLYTKLYLASVRGGISTDAKSADNKRGASKRYAGMRYDADKAVADPSLIEFVGMEVVRRDWTDLAKEVQRTLFQLLFSEDDISAPVQAYLEQIVNRLRAGELDSLLVYRRGLRKDVASYTKNIPPHVQAVIKAQAGKNSKAKPPRLVAYVITVAGPEMIAEQQHAIDREHYLARQIQPIAEPVLEALGLSFSQVIGDDRQIDLFG